MAVLKLLINDRLVICGNRFADVQAAARGYFWLSDDKSIVHSVVTDDTYKVPQVTEELKTVEHGRVHFGYGQRNE
eukprot:2651122-Amphidinium_carterae.1